MLREFLCAVALVVLASGTGLSDIHQNQQFAIGMDSLVNLSQGISAAGDAKFLTVSLGQTATAGSGLSGIQSDALGQQGQSLTTGADPSTYGQQNVTVGLTQQATGTGGVGLNLASPTLLADRLPVLAPVSTPLIAGPAVTVGQISLFSGSPLFGTIRP